MHDILWKFRRSLEKTLLSRGEKIRSPLLEQQQLSKPKSSVHLLKGASELFRFFNGPMMKKKKAEMKLTRIEGAPLTVGEERDMAELIASWILKIVIESEKDMNNDNPPN